MFDALALKLLDTMTQLAARNRDRAGSRGHRDVAREWGHAVNELEAAQWRISRAMRLERRGVAMAATDTTDAEKIDDDDGIPF